MIITRTPMRISLGGGGTDLPSYYRENSGGFLVAAAVSRHVYIAANERFDDDILVKYSKIERVPDSASLNHPLLREALRFTGLEKRIEISAMSDIPAHTGLGSSGSFLVGVLKCLRAFRRELRSNTQIAEEACNIEIDILGEPVGKQDQYIAAVGGVTAFKFNPDDTVEIEPVPMTSDAHDRLAENLLLFFTGLHRSASEILIDQDVRSKSGDPGMTSNLDTVKQIGEASYESLVAEDFSFFAKLMTEQWNLKRDRSPNPLNEQIDGLIQAGLTNGALGGKLVGAGGGGFLLFYSEQKATLRSKMRDFGLQEVRFTFDYEGSKILVG